jgi:hypothetical protein
MVLADLARGIAAQDMTAETIEAFLRAPVAPG